MDLGSAFLDADNPDVICEVVWTGRMPLQPVNAVSYGASASTIEAHPKKTTKGRVSFGGVTWFSAGDLPMGLR